MVQVLEMMVIHHLGSWESRLSTLGQLTMVIPTGVYSWGRSCTGILLDL